MSEDGGTIFDRIFRRNNNFRENGPKLIPDKEAEARAREAVTLFVNAEKQEPLVTYHANKVTTFDLDKQKRQTGVIIRVGFEAEGEQEYSFYAISIDKRNRSHIYNLHYGEGGSGRVGVPKEEFRSKDPFIEEFSFKGNQFLIEDFFDNLDGIRFGRVDEETVFVRKIDVMVGGLVDRKKEPIRKSDEVLFPTQGKLVPQT